MGGKKLGYYELNDSASCFVPKSECSLLRASANEGRSEVLLLSQGRGEKEREIFYLR